MDELYQKILKYLQEDYSNQEIKSIIDFMDWLKGHYLSIGDCGSFIESFPIIFDAQSKETILDDVVFKLRNSSISGLINSKDSTHVFDVRCTDLKSEYEYHEAIADELDDITWQWIDDKDHELGVCRIYNRKDHTEILDIFFIAFDEFLTEYEKKVSQIEFDYGYFEFEAYVIEHLKKEIIDHLANVIEKFTVIYCSGSLYDSVDGDHNGYFVLFGYNPNYRYGEGWVIYCLAPH